MILFFSSPPLFNTLVSFHTSHDVTYYAQSSGAREIVIILMLQITTPNTVPLRKCKVWISYLPTIITTPAMKPMTNVVLSVRRLRKSIKYIIITEKIKLIFSQILKDISIQLTNNTRLNGNICIPLAYQKALPEIG